MLQIAARAPRADVLFVVPRLRLSAFNASIGGELDPSHSRVFRASGGTARVAPAACFALSGESVSRGVPKGLGHGCYNALARRVGDGGVSFCWPPCMPHPAGARRSNAARRAARAQ